MMPFIINTGSTKNTLELTNLNNITIDINNKQLLEEFFYIVSTEGAEVAEEAKSVNGLLTSSTDADGKTNHWRPTSSYSYSLTKHSKYQTYVYSDSATNSIDAKTLLYAPKTSITSSNCRISLIPKYSNVIKGISFKGLYQDCDAKGAGGYFSSTRTFDIVYHHSTSATNPAPSDTGLETVNGGSTIAEFSWPSESKNDDSFTTSDRISMCLYSCDEDEEFICIADLQITISVSSWLAACSKLLNTSKNKLDFPNRGPSAVSVSNNFFEIKTTKGNLANANTTSTHSFITDTSNADNTKFCCTANNRSYKDYCTFFTYQNEAMSSPHIFLKVTTNSDCTAEVYYLPVDNELKDITFTATGLTNTAWSTSFYPLKKTIATNSSALVLIPPLKKGDALIFKHIPTTNDSTPITTLNFYTGASVSKDFLDKIAKSFGYVWNNIAAIDSDLKPCFECYSGKY